MKITRIALLLMALFVYAAKADFTLKYIIDMSGQRFEETIKQTETKQRIDLAGYSIIQSSGTTKGTILIPASRTYMGVDMNALGGKFGSGKPVDFKPTDKKETINGYETREFKANAGGIQITVFTTHSFPIAKSVEKVMRDWNTSPTADAFQKILAAVENGTGWPIRIIMETSETNYIMTFESLHEGDIDDREFAVPNDYKELSLPELSLPGFFGQ
jgi:hypothetical protein